MKPFSLIFPFTLVHMIYANCGGNTGSTYCPSRPYPCQSPSSLADLVCYSYRKAEGLNYALIGFGTGISALCSININCESSSRMDVLRVYGFIAELTQPVKRCDKNDAGGEQISQLVYVDVSRGPGCPQIFPVNNFPYSVDSFNGALYRTGVPTDLAYQIYTQTRRDYPAQCNIFQSDSSEEVGLAKSIVSVSLAQIQSALVFNSPSSNNSAAQKYVNQYGICGLNCTQSPSPEPTSNPPLFYEICSTYGYNNYMNCCKDFEDTIQLYQILQSYGYKQFDSEAPNEACKISTMWARGYNGRRRDTGSNCNNCNNYLTSFCSIAIIPQLVKIVDEGTSNANQVGFVYVLMKGLCEKSIEQKIMKYFLNTC